MKKSYLIFVGLCALLAAVVVTRWPRLDSEGVTITHSEVSGDKILVEYRMSRPFEVAIRHRIRKSIKWPEGPGVHVGPSWSPLREDKPEFIASACDFIRGEHYVRLCFQRGAPLTIDANGRRLELSAWSVPDAKGVKWCLPREGVCYGDGIGNDILYFAALPEQEEYLMIYAGSNVRRVE
jgi:hypothetical protein